MITKLDKIVPGFRRFSRSQFLTDSHLNQIFDHFDDQIRLSRVNLSGVGIVCGFEISSARGAVTINQGLGITTDGDLLHLYKDDEGNKTIDFTSINYRYFRKYDNSRSDYSPFFYQNDDQIELYELLTKDEDSETLNLRNFSNDGRPNLEDMVVLLYIENYERNINQCSSLNCDGEGIDVVANYKVLITTKANAEFINSHDNTISRINYRKLYYQLPEVLLTKVIFEIEDFVDFNTFLNKLASPFSNTKILDDLVDGFKTIFDALKLPDLGIEFESLMSTLFDPDSGELERLDIQYRYDLLKDIVDTYQEIKRIMLELSSKICNANINDFPKHLMLGELVNEKSCYDYRHSFYKSVAHTSKAGKVGVNCNDSANNGGAGLTVCYDIHEPEQRLYSLLLRTLKQLESYNLVLLGQIKITPSRLLGDLSQKAIPFYNKVDEELIKLWNFDKTAKNLAKSNVSYHRDLLDSDNPLSLYVDKDFYRIEGHLGQGYKHVIEELKNLKTQNAVSFNIVALRISNPIGLIGGEIRREGEGVVAAQLTEIRELAEDYTSYYVSRRQGLEHRAGVSPRGTFVLVFLDDIAVLPGEGEGEGSVSRRRKLSSSAERMELAANPVIADFMVPYLCCDESVLKLELPMNTLCFGRDTEPIPFKASPPNGFVTADIPRGLNGGVIRDSNGDSFFNPNLVSPELINTPIRFELNNQDTGAVIIIHRLPEPIVSTTVVYNNPFKTEVTVTYNVSGPFLNEIEEFEWDFLGDDTFINVEPDALGNVVRQYQNPVESAPNTIKPRLRVRSKFCENQISIDPITFEDPIVIELDFDRNEICVNPENCDAPLHIVLVIDESSSIDQTEAAQIRQGLRNFIDDQEGSSNLISLINMDNSDNGAPKRRIEQKNVNASTKAEFVQWIDDYRNSGINFSSDFWSSSLGYLTNELDEPNNITVNPDIVIVIADGMQAQDEPGLISRYRKLKETTPVYSYALSNGVYLRQQNGLVAALTKLLGKAPVESATDFSDIDTTDYASFENFAQLGAFLNNLKNILDNSIGCVEKVNIVTVRPENGVVTTLGAATYKGLRIDQRVITISPLEFEALGETIRFAVEGFETEEILVIERNPENVAVAIDDISYNEDNTQAIVTFSISGKFLPVTPKLFWNFGDGGEIVEESELTQTYEYTDISSLEGRTANVTLEIANQVCEPVTQSTRVVFEDVVEEVSLSIQRTLCLDGSGDADTSVPFTVTPADGTLRAVRRMNGLRVGTNEITFASSSFVNYDIPIEFTVNDQPVSATITVIKKPIVSISTGRYYGYRPEEGEPTLDEIPLTEGDILEGSISDNDFVSNEALMFRIKNQNDFDESRYNILWDFGDNSTAQGSIVGHNYRFRRDTNVTVRLLVSDGLCETEVKEEIELLAAT